ncbi:MAG: hypothetical protein A2167_00115 [Planctomycetes bacterium RBG_13_46_10]|nr:MAG: hypothetical protein A2167_00115 [Planctomycetes bacterium RBG_13_46_10]
MCRLVVLVTGIFILICSGATFGAQVILNEYNAVSNTNFLNGGDSAADDDGGRASDSYFGRIQGNGGNWFELVIITDHLDMRRWNLDIYENGQFDETLTITNHPIWSDLRSGTIITVSADVPSDVNYNPEAGDWWINVQANNNANGQYIEASNFPVSSDSWQLRIRNASGAVVFGPAGEGVSPQTGIGNTEIFRLEDDPSDSIAANSDKYDDGDDFSTFGAPNRWGMQNFRSLRNVEPAPSSITLTDPNGTEVLTAGSTYTIRWESQGLINQVLVEFSIDDGKTWSGVYPSNVGNAGQYEWLVPLVDADSCLVRVSSSDNPGVYDVGNATFSISKLLLEVVLLSLI